MARISQRILDNLKTGCVESRLSEIHERMRNRGLSPLAVKDGYAYGMVQEEGGQKLFRMSVAEFFKGSGEMGDFEDVTEEYGTKDTEYERDRKRVAGAYVEAVINRDRVESAQRLRELVEIG